MAWLGGDDPPPDPTAVLEAENGARQWRRLCELVDQAIEADAFVITREILCELNRLAIEGVVPDGTAGAFRDGPCTIEGSRHVPPPADEVPGHVDDLLVHLAPATLGSAQAPRAVHRAAFALWRLNWIHPFRDGNGRTARALAHLVLCRDLRQDLPGPRPWVARILDDKRRYYHCLEQADLGWRKRRVADVNNLVGFLERLIRAQLRDAGVEGA